MLVNNFTGKSMLNINHRRVNVCRILPVNNVLYISHGTQGSRTNIIPSAVMRSAFVRSEEKEQKI